VASDQARSRALQDRAKRQRRWSEAPLRRTTAQPAEPDATLRIALEDIGGTSWWAGLLTTLTSQSGSAQLRFVGTVDGERRYEGPAFSAPRTFGCVPPEEQWAPGMAASLTDLRRVLENDGWVEVGRGTEPWALLYRRPGGGGAGR
jgi:hypothetical protein